MHLLSALCSGFAAAANGTAEIYIRGSSTRATWYPDFEASSSDSSGADITLDAYGSALVYVNQLVDVVVKDADGNAVRSYGDGYASPNIEVISPAFTGIDYVTAASAVNEPTTLQAVLNLWETNAGAPDWNVDIGGVDTTMLNAFGALSGLVFNVKSPAYGAVGDGVANDQSAISSALAAAVAAGGGIVFFPKGTYLISTAIEWDHRVSMVGIGGGLSLITTNSASNARIITWTTGTALNSPIRISGMAFASTVTNSGTQVYNNVAVNVLFEACYFGASASAVGIHVDVAGANSFAAFRDCFFYVNGATHALVGTGGSTVTIEAMRCVFKTTVTSFGAGLYRHDARSQLTDCIFDITSVTAAGTNYGVEMASTNNLSVRGCRFRATTQPFTACIFLVATALVTTDGCDFGISVPYLGSVTGVGSRLQMLGRARQTGSGAAYTISSNVDQDEIVSTGAAPTFTGPTGYFPGQKECLLIINNSAGNWASMTFTSLPSLIVGATAVNISQRAYVEMIFADLTVSGTYEWWVVDIRVG